MESVQGYRNFEDALWSKDSAHDFSEIHPDVKLHSSSAPCWCCTGLTLLYPTTTVTVAKADKNKKPDSLKDDPKPQSEPELERDRYPLDRAKSQLAASSLMSLSASQNRVRIQNMFCDLFYPVGADSLHSLFQDSEPRTRALTAAEQVRTDAADVLCLIQVALGAYRRDWLLQAMSMYGRALTRLQRAIKRPSSQPVYDSLIAAVYFLIKCEAFICTSWVSSGWMQHTLALLQLLSAGLGKAETVGLGRWGYLQFSHCYAVGYGLVHKRRVSAAPWIRHLDPQHASPTSIALQVPSCLENLDVVCQKDCGPARTTKALRSAIRVRGQLLDQLVYLTPSSHDPPYRSVSIEQFNQFCDAIDVSERLFTVAYDFSDFGMALMHRDTWVQLFVLDQALLDLRRQRWYLISRMYVTELEGLESELDRLSDQLCQSIPYFTQSQTRCAGRLAIQEALYFLEDYFRRAEASKHVLWCEAVKKSIVLGWRIAQIISPTDEQSDSSASTDDSTRQNSTASDSEV